MGKPIYWDSRSGLLDDPIGAMNLSRCKPDEVLIH